MDTYSRAYAAVDLDAVVHNVTEMKKGIGTDTNIIAVIKTDGYGHGAVPIAKELEKLSFLWGYAVATVEEGQILRRHRIQKPILVLGATFPEQYQAMAELGMRPNVYSLRMALQMEEAMEQTGRKLPVHIKIDTGLSRLGFSLTEEAVEDIVRIHGLPHIVIEGIFTHFAKADAKDKAMAKDQLQSFLQMKEKLQNHGVSPGLCHISNSAGIIDLPEANLDLVRAGISLYGLWPSDEVQKGRLHLLPAMSLKSRIVFLKELEAGRTISYGATYTVERPSRIATIPVGYGDGYPRSLSGKGSVLIHGKRAPICGRICMDQFMVDVTKIPEAAEGDEVVLIGKSGEDAITMEELGELSGRFHYELACCLNKRIPRIYLKDGEVKGSHDCFGE